MVPVSQRRQEQIVRVYCTGSFLPIFQSASLKGLCHDALAEVNHCNGKKIAKFLWFSEPASGER